VTAELFAGDVVFHTPALTRGVLGWDTLGGPDPENGDQLGARQYPGGASAEPAEGGGLGSGGQGAC
jgi:hypothetical protein